MFNLFDCIPQPKKEVYQPSNTCPPTNNCCPQLPGTLVRINIPAGTVINLLNLIEIDSPSGICLIVRIPLFGGSCNTTNDNSNPWMQVLTAIKQAGGSIEFV